MSNQQNNTEFVVHLRALANMLDCAENGGNRIVPGIVRSIREAWRVGCPLMHSWPDATTATFLYVPNNT